jgi:hypothetical protein
VGVYRTSARSLGSTIRNGQIVRNGTGSPPSSRQPVPRPFGYQRYPLSTQIPQPSGASAPVEIRKISEFGGGSAWALRGGLSVPERFPEPRGIPHGVRSALRGRMRHLTEFRQLLAPSEFNNLLDIPGPSFAVEWRCSRSVQDVLRCPRDGVGRAPPQGRPADRRPPRGGCEPPRGRT